MDRPRAIDLRHVGHERVICSYLVDGVIVDPGPASCLETLLAALGDERPEAVFLTHIHLDHAGATGSLVRRFPDLEVAVHEVGAPHMVAPERLWRSAARLYGDDMERLWGEMVPVPEANLRVLRGGESLRGFQVAYTPGHASHHVSYLHERSNVAYVGDTAGVRIAPSEVTLMPTPPPDIDPPAWERSLRLLQGWAPDAIALTHFGLFEDVERHLADAAEQVRALEALPDDTTNEAFDVLVAERVALLGDLAETYRRGANFDQLWLGMERYLGKRAAAGTS